MKYSPLEFLNLIPYLLRFAFKNYHLNCKACALALHILSGHQLSCPLVPKASSMPKCMPKVHKTFKGLSTDKNET